VFEACPPLPSLPAPLVVPPDMLFAPPLRVAPALDMPPRVAPPPKPVLLPVRSPPSDEPQCTSTLSAGRTSTEKQIRRTLERIARQHTAEE
jgi:hypothetical protein